KYCGTKSCGLIAASRFFYGSLLKYLIESTYENLPRRSAGKVLKANNLIAKYCGTRSCDWSSLSVVVTTLRAQLASACLARRYCEGSKLRTARSDVTGEQIKLRKRVSA